MLVCCVARTICPSNRFVETGYCLIHIYLPHRVQHPTKTKFIQTLHKAYANFTQP